MYFCKLPYILFRQFPDFGLLTDNQNFGYDTASKSCRKVGDLLLSKEGCLFYSTLSATPEPLRDIVKRLAMHFRHVPDVSLWKDAKQFFLDLSHRGFIYQGSDDRDYAMQKLAFSYYDHSCYEWTNKLKVSATRFGQDEINTCWLTRVHIDISSQCNENCIHCYIPKRDKCSMMSRDLFLNIIEQCKELNVLNVTISGGEPMLSPHLIFFLSQCRENNLSVNLLSNLTLLSDEILNELAKSPLVSVQTSLYSMNDQVHDSITRNRGSWSRTFQAIGKLYERNIPMQINCPVMKQNVHCYKDVLEWASNQNIESSSDFVLFGCYDNSKSNLGCRLPKEEVSLFIEDRMNNEAYASEIQNNADEKNVHEDDFICSVCKSSLCISNTGQVYPCEGWQSMHLGHLNEQSLKQIWENNPTTRKLRELKYRDFPQCRCCNYKQYCSSCLIMHANENEKGDYSIINPYLCEVAKTYHEEITKMSKS